VTDQASPQKENRRDWKRRPWKSVPTWGKWVVGTAGALLLIGIGVAIGSSKASDLRAERNDAEAEADAIRARAPKLIAESRQHAIQIESEAEQEATRIIRHAGSERIRMKRTLSHLNDDVESTKGELESVEDSLSQARHTKSLSSMSNGTWQIEVDYLPGTWRAPGGPTCWWEQRQEPGGEGAGEGFNRNYGSAEENILIHIDSPYFYTNKCGTWKRIGD
jgi:hypothetical protein